MVLGAKRLGYGETTREELVLGAKRLGYGGRNDYSTRVEIRGEMIRGERLGGKRLGGEMSCYLTDHL